VRSLVAWFFALGLLISTSRARAGQQEAPSPAPAPAPARSPEAPRSAGAAMAVGGLGLTLASYAYAAGLGSSLYRKDSGYPVKDMRVPIVGPWLALRRGPTQVDFGTFVSGRLVRYGVDASGPASELALLGGIMLFLPEFFLFAANPLAQAGGLVISGVGVAKMVGGPADRTERAASPRAKVAFVPSAPGCELGASLQVTSW